MHSCSKIHNRLVDLVFNEMGEDERFALSQELNSCRQCRELYTEMADTMILFDRVTEDATMDESYWAAYENKLWHGLRGEIQPVGWRQRVVNWIRAHSVSGFMLPVATAVLLLLMISGLWLILSQRGDAGNVDQGQSASSDTTQELSQAQPTSQPQAVKPQDEGRKNKTGVAPSNSIKKSSKSSKRGLELVSLPRNERDKISEEGTVAALNVRLTKHLESSMMLLRSFRNARPSAGDTLADISFEKGLARALLGRNAVLRQEVEEQGDIRSNELLAGIEPFLLDIANLPDRASPQEMGVIKDVLEEFGLITELQIYSAMALHAGF